MLKIRTKFLAPIALVAALGAGYVNYPSAANANSATTAPAYIDRGQGFVYFFVQNHWGRTINNLFGWVYGYNRGRPTARVVNNPHMEGIKVSIGAHSPGKTALYRFKVPEKFALFERYSLLVSDVSLFHPRKVVR